MYGVGSIINIIDTLPEYLQTQINTILSVFLRFSMNMQKEELITEIKEFQTDNVFVTADSLGPEYERLLEKIQRAKQGKEIDEDSEEDEESDIFEENDELYDSPFESKSFIEYIKQTLIGLSSKNPGGYQALSSSLPPDQQVYIQEIFSK